MIELYTLYLSDYGDFDEVYSLAPDRADLERAAAIALAQYHRLTKQAPLDFYHFGLEWEKLRNTDPVK